METTPVDAVGVGGRPPDRTPCLGYFPELWAGSLHAQGVSHPAAACQLLLRALLSFEGRK